MTLTDQLLDEEAALREVVAAHVANCPTCLGRRKVVPCPTCEDRAATAVEAFDLGYRFGRAYVISERAVKNVEEADKATEGET